MNEQTYTCSQCGKSEGFTELVWEQRKYFVDGHREGIGFSDPVEDSEVLVQVTCDDCGAIVVSNPITQPQESDQELFLKQVPHYWEDPPKYADYENMSGNYMTQFIHLLMTDIENEFDTILQEYDASPPDKRFVINWLFVRLCGYSLINIIKKVYGHEPDESNEPNQAAR